MAAPYFIASAANFTGSRAISFTSAAITSAVDQIILPVKYDQNFRIAHTLPDPTDILGSWIDGFLPETGLSYLLGFHGIPHLRKADDIFQSVGLKAWDAVIKSKIPKLSITDLIYALYSGMITKTQFNTFMKNYGYLKEQIPVLMDLAKPRFDSSVILNNYFRATADSGSTIDLIRRNVGCNISDATDILYNSYTTPTIGELLSYSAKGIYDPNVVSKLGLDSEYDRMSKAIPWANAIGFYENTQLGREPNKITRNVILDKWCDHWSLMGNEKAFEAHRKLRVDRINRYTSQVPTVTTFTDEDLQMTLQANDIVPGQRATLEALSYNNIQFRQLRGMYLDGYISDDELYQLLLDNGYLTPDATAISNWYKKLKSDNDKKVQEAKEKKDFGKKIAAIYNAYETGSISRSQAITALTSLDSETDRVSANLDAIDININNKRVKYLISMVKTEFFHGLYDGLTAYSQLVQSGVTDIMARQYVIIWQRQLSMPRKFASIATILDWYKRLLISQSDASNRLATLGVSNGDILIYIEQSQQDINKQIAAQQAKNAATERQAALAALRLQKAMEAKHNADKAELRSYSSIPTMKRWYLDSIIDEATVISRMQSLDVPDEDILRYLEEWKLDSKQPTIPPANG